MTRMQSNVALTCIDLTCDFVSCTLFHLDRKTLCFSSHFPPDICNLIRQRNEFLCFNMFAYPLFSFSLLYFRFTMYALVHCRVHANECLHEISDAHSIQDLHRRERITPKGKEVSEGFCKPRTDLLLYPWSVFSFWNFLFRPFPYLQLIRNESRLSWLFDLPRLQVCF